MEGGRCLCKLAYLDGSSQGAKDASGDGGIECVDDDSGDSVGAVG